MSKTRLSRDDLVVGKRYGMNDYYADDTPLLEGTIVTVLNTKGGEGSDRVMFMYPPQASIVVVITEELDAANLAKNPDAEEPTTYRVPIKSLQELPERGQP